MMLPKFMAVSGLVLMAQVVFSHPTSDIRPLPDSHREVTDPHGHLNYLDPKLKEEVLDRLSDGDAYMYDGIDEKEQAEQRKKAAELAKLPLLSPDPQMINDPSRIIDEISAAKAKEEAGQPYKISKPEGKADGKQGKRSKLLDTIVDGVNKLPLVLGADLPSIKDASYYIKGVSELAKEKKLEDYEDEREDNFSKDDEREYNFSKEDDQEYKDEDVIYNPDVPLDDDECDIEAFCVLVERYSPLPSSTRPREPTRDRCNIDGQGKRGTPKKDVVANRLAKHLAQVYHRKESDKELQDYSREWVEIVDSENPRLAVQTMGNQSTIVAYPPEGEKAVQNFCATRGRGY